MPSKPTIRPGDFLAPAAARDFRQRLDAARATGRTLFVGQWCASTRWALVAEVAERQVTRWHVAGPMDRSDAAAWLGTVEAALTPAPDTAH